jgi:hypothetical protein
MSRALALLVALPAWLAAAGAAHATREPGVRPR